MLHTRRSRPRDAEVFSRGEVRHRYHKTIDFTGWHRVSITGNALRATRRRSLFSANPEVSQVRESADLGHPPASASELVSWWAASRRIAAEGFVAFYSFRRDRGKKNASILGGDSKGSESGEKAGFSGPIGTVLA